MFEDDDFPSVAAASAESPPDIGGAPRLSRHTRARCIVEWGSREAKLSIPGSLDVALGGNVWLDDIAATLIEGNPIAFHVPSSAPVLRAALAKLFEQLDLPGRFIRISQPPNDEDADVEALEGALLAAAGGKSTCGGSVTFHPASWLIEAVADLPAESRAAAQCAGIAIRDVTGRPSPAAAAAAAFLASADLGEIDVHVLPEAAAGLRHALYILLRATGRIRRDSYHVIGLDRVALDEEAKEPTGDRALTTALAVGLAAASQRYLRGKIRRRVDFSELDATGYLHDQYGQEIDNLRPSGILAEDEDLICWLAQTLPSFLVEGSVVRLAVPGWGPFSYLGLLLAPFLAADAIADLTDPADSNVRFACRWQAGLLDPKDATVAEKFERFIARAGGARYVGCEKRLRSHARIGPGELSALAPGAYDVVADPFVSCSISSSRQVFWESIRTKRQALNDGPNAALVSLHMLGSHLWQTYPNVYLSVGDVVQAYADTGLETQIFVAERRLGGDLDWDGMVAVIARPVTRRDPFCPGSKEVTGV